MDIKELLELSFRVETIAEKIYLEAAALFPEARTLFEKLACEEARHADIVTITMKLHDLDALPPEFAADLTPMIGETIAIAAVLDERLSRQDITLPEALALSIAMEESGIEVYFQQVMRAESTHDALNYMKKFCIDSEFHADLLREFREVHDLNRQHAGHDAAAVVPRLNCWEAMQCGREPGGAHEQDLGTCPVVKENRLDGVHGGSAAGRACWIVAGTLCSGAACGTEARKLESCRICDFYRRVRDEECPSFECSAELLARLSTE